MLPFMHLKLLFANMLHTYKMTGLFDQLISVFPTLPHINEYSQPVPLALIRMALHFICLLCYSWPRIAVCLLTF